MLRERLSLRKKGDATYVLFQYGQRYNAEKSMLLKWFSKVCRFLKSVTQEQIIGFSTDVSQLEYMVDKVKEYHYKSVGFILDRGYFSKTNIRYMDKMGTPLLSWSKAAKSWYQSLFANIEILSRQTMCMAKQSWKGYMKMILLIDIFIYTSILPSRLLNENN